MRKRFRHCHLHFHSPSTWKYWLLMIFIYFSRSSPDLDVPKNWNHQSAFRNFAKNGQWNIHGLNVHQVNEQQIEFFTPPIMKLVKCSTFLTLNLHYNILIEPWKVHCTICASPLNCGNDGITALKRHMLRSSVRSRRSWGGRRHVDRLEGV